MSYQELDINFARSSVNDLIFDSEIQLINVDFDRRDMEAVIYFDSSEVSIDINFITGKGTIVGITEGGITTKSGSHYITTKDGRKIGIKK